MTAQAFEGFMRCQVAFISADRFLIATGRFGQRRHVDLAREERDFQTGSKLFHESLIGIGVFTSKKVVDVQDGGLPHKTAFVKVADKVCQCRRIRSTRNHGDHGSCSTEQALGTNSLFYCVYHQRLSFQFLPEGNKEAARLALPQDALLACLL